jgi:hypothetical protein
MNKFILLFAGIICIRSLSFSQSRTLLLEGTIQQYRVILQLNIEDSSCTARYFYEKQRKDIELNGVVRKNGTISVVSEGWGSKDNIAMAEKIELNEKNGIYSGTWTNRKKTLPVQLKMVITEKFTSPYDEFSFIRQLKKEDPYNYVRISALEFIKDSAKQMNTCTLDWYHEKYSGTVLFRVLKGYESAAIKKINDKLTETHIQGSLGALECFSPHGESEYSQTVNYFFANDDLLSVNLFTSYSCGGAHPDFGSQALNFNGHNGQQLSLDEVFRFGKGAPPKQDSPEWYTYRSTVFAPKIVSLLKQFHPHQMQKPKKTEEECDYSDPEIWNFPNWYFTPKGLYVGAVFARAARSCDEPAWSVIPYQALQPYANSESNVVLPR